MSKRVNNITIEGAKVIFRDFTGTYDKKYNPTCQRKFGVLLEDEELVEQLKEDGWNVKTLSSNDEYENDAYYLPVKVKFGNYPPTACIIKGSKKVKLDEDTIGQLDNVVISNVDLIISPYTYPAIAATDKNPGRPGGVAAYLKAIYVTIVEDDLAKKYADFDDDFDE